MTGIRRTHDLTIHYCASTIEHMRSWARGLLVALILVTFSGSVWATCVEGVAVSTQQQMACCRDGEFTCPPNANTNDCCTTGPSRSHDAVVIAKIDPVHALAAVVATWALLPDVALTAPVPTGSIAATSPPLTQQSPPPYIAYSSLLI